jgi:hypothetical protein
MPPLRKRVKLEHMPYIPYLKPQQQEAVPAMPLNRERAPTVDTRGVQQALGQLSEASQQPMTPVAPFLAPGQGLEAAGREISGAGDVMARLAMASAEAENDHDAAVAQNRLDSEWAAFQADVIQRNVDPREWPKLWEDKSGRAIQDVMRKENMSPIARKRIGIYVSKWSTQTKGRVVIDAVKETGQRAEAAGIAGVMQANAAGNPDLARERLKVLRERSYFDPMKGQQLEQSIAAGERQMAEDSYISAVRQYGVEAAEKILDDPKFGSNLEGWTESDRERLRNYGQAVGRDQLSAAVDDVANFLAENPNASPADVETAAGGRLAPAQLEKWKAEALDRNEAWVKAQRMKPENINAAFARLDDAVDKFDMSDPNAREDYERIRRAAVALLPPGQRGIITEELNRKWRASKDLPDPPDWKVQTVRNQIGNLFEAGALGKFRSDPVFDPETGRTVTKEDVAEKNKAEALRGAMLGHMLTYLRENPNAADADVRAELDAVKNGRAPVIRFTPAPAAPAEAPQGAKPKRTRLTEEDRQMLDDLRLPGDDEGGGVSAGTRLIPYDPPPDPDEE